MANDDAGVGGSGAPLMQPVIAAIRRKLENRFIAGYCRLQGRMIVLADNRD